MKLIQKYLSGKYKIKKSEMVILPHVTRDKDFGFLYAKIETPKGDVDVINVHLENSDEGSKTHLIFLLNFRKSFSSNSPSLKSALFILS